MRYRIEKGRMIKPVIVGVNEQSGLYHKTSCRFYEYCEVDMDEAKAIAYEFVCGTCCNNKED